MSIDSDSELAATILSTPLLDPGDTFFQTQYRSFSGDPSQLRGLDDTDREPGPTWAVLCDLMAQRYAACSTDALVQASVGKLYTPHDRDATEFDKALETLSLSDQEAKKVILVSQEPSTRTVIAVRNDDAVVVQQGDKGCETTEYKDFGAEFTPLKGFAMYPTDLLGLTNELAALMSGFELNAETRHPALDMTYDEASDYLKALCLFCTSVGLTARQLIAVCELAASLTVPFDRFVRLLRLIQNMSVAAREATLREVAEKVSPENRLLLLCDLIDLVLLGDYDSEWRCRAIEMAADVTGKSADLAFAIYRRLRE